MRESFWRWSEDGDAEIAGDAHAVHLDEVIAGHLRDRADDEQEDEDKQERKNGGPAVGLVGVVDDFPGDALEAERTDRDDDDERKDAGELKLVRLEVGAGANERPEDFVAGNVYGGIVKVKP